ncbi:ERGIC2 [Cordylochernes scorpioides]|uniref:ERGIC2 n=1 Tax=Cordylochernes scorpioides TaxID=51811 RepID=A0ABY6L448_9ARAC|nr:ERGIC2 [Cordylochernes scorpioides]
MDSTNVHTMETVGETELKHTDVEYDLTEFHTAHWRTRQEVNRYLREEYHAVHETLWHNGYSGSLWGTIADHKQPPLQRAAQLTGCRISGSVMVNKVAGNLHVTMGSYMIIYNLDYRLELQDTNFSHRIERFSFGESSTGIFDPLEGEEKLTNHGNYRYQYYIQVVPTDVVSLSGRVTSTYQYSVTEQRAVCVYQQRGIDHESNSHGTPGINFRYQFFPLKVRVIKYTAPQWKFAVRVVAMLGGVHMIIGQCPHNIYMLY